jgi:hypothetical protein
LLHSATSAGEFAKEGKDFGKILNVRDDGYFRSLEVKAAISSWQEIGASVQ